ncbi:ankyrin repeat domain-containing protein [Parashewanella tropica]|uniref:ankyrin repeat domain-containing protein n=1 Tax=Parashewanella tropica TaxID=2547970 RepID=UPI00105A3C13|nr:ankyrin repeat domain-containing protein [Parashewanella tropica]
MAGDPILSEKAPLIAEYRYPDGGCVSAEEIGGDYQLDLDSKKVTELTRLGRFQLSVQLENQSIVTLFCEQKTGFSSGQPRWSCKNVDREVCWCFCSRDTNPKVTEAVKDAFTSKKPIYLFAAIIEGNEAAVRDHLRLPRNLAVRTHEANFSVGARADAKVNVGIRDTYYCDGNTYFDFLCAGQPVLQLAVIGGQAKLIPILVDAGANPEQMNKCDHRALDLAVLSGKVDETEALLKAHAQIHQFKGRNLLDIALNQYSKPIKLASVLLSYGANLDELDGQKHTVLMNRMIKEDKDGIIFALKNGADISVQGESNHNAVSFMVKKMGTRENLELFFQHFKDQRPDINDIPFKMAFRYAARGDIV